MTNNGQKVQFIEGLDHIRLTGVCPFCHGEGCRTALCWSGDVTVSDDDAEFGETFALNLHFVNFETAHRLGKEIATAARQKLQAQGVNGWEV